MQHLSLTCLEQSDQHYSGLVAALICEYLSSVKVTGVFLPVFIVFEQLTQHLNKTYKEKETKSWQKSN